MGAPTTNNEADAWLAELDPTLAAQFQKQGMANGDAGAGPASPFNSPTVSADSKHTRVTIVPITDDDPVAPPVKGLDMPTVSDPVVEISEGSGGKKSTMKHSEVLKSPDYVDNSIQTLKAQPTQMTLKVKEMELIYASGKSITVKMEWVKFGTDPLASTFVRQDKFIMPVDDHGKVLIDRNNTPNIVKCAEYVNQEMRKRSAQRVQMAEIVSSFASAIAALGGAAAGAHEVTGGGGGGHGGGGDSEGGGSRGGGKRGGGNDEGGHSGGGGGGGNDEGGHSGGGEGGAGDGGSSHGGGTSGSHDSPSGAGGGTGDHGTGQPSGGQSHGPGSADTPQAPPRRPERGGPLDSTGEVKPKGGETQDTDSPKGGGQKGEKSQPTTIERHPIQETPRIPDNQEITVKTPGGAQKMTVGEYRKRWYAAEKWLGAENQKLNQRRGAGPPKELIKQAQEKFGLDDNWQSIANPYIYGKL